MTFRQYRIFHTASTICTEVLRVDFINVKGHHPKQPGTNTIKNKNNRVSWILRTLSFSATSIWGNKTVFILFWIFPAPNRAAVIIGTTVGSLLLIFILLVFLAILYWKLSNRRRYEKEFSNEIRYWTAPYTQHDAVNGFSGFRVGKLSCCNTGNKSTQPGNFLPVVHYHKELPAAFVSLE